MQRCLDSCCTLKARFALVRTSHQRRHLRTQMPRKNRNLGNRMCGPLIWSHSAPSCSRNKLATNLSVCAVLTSYVAKFPIVCDLARQKQRVLAEKDSAQTSTSGRCASAYEFHALPSPFGIQGISAMGHPRSALIQEGGASLLLCRSVF